MVTESMEHRISVGWVLGITFLVLAVVQFLEDVTRWF